MNIIKSILSGGNIGDNINQLLAALNVARDGGRILLADLEERVKADPSLNVLLTTLRGILSKPISAAQQEEFLRLRTHGNALNSARSRDLPKADPDPVPIPTAFPYGTELQWDPLTLPEAALLKPGDRGYKRGTAAAYVVESATSEHALDGTWQLVFVVAAG